MQKVRVMTKDRVEYFNRMFESLQLTSHRNFEPVIYDDNSKEKAKLERLSKLNQQYEIKRFEQDTGTKRIWLTMLEDSINDGEDICIHVQDDIIFHPDWFHESLAVYNQIKNIGILTPWDRSSRCEENSYFVYSPRTKGNCNIGGVCWFTSRPFAERVLAKYDNIVKRPLVGMQCFDSAFRKMCLNMGFKVVVTNPSWVDHFGIVSIAHPKRRRVSKAYRASCFAGKDRDK